MGSTTRLEPSTLLGSRTRFEPNTHQRIFLGLHAGPLIFYTISIHIILSRIQLKISQI
jgi:hypothetical protein